VDPKDRLHECTGFDWDEGNATKNWDRHDVDPIECEQVFFNRPLVVQRDRGHSTFEARYFVLGRTDMNRLLFIVFTIQGTKVRVISARDMTNQEQEKYKS